MTSTDTAADRAVLVGAGGFGETWWPALAAFRDRVDVVAIVDPDETARSRAAAHFAVRHRASRLDGDLLAAVGATIVIDSSPPPHRAKNVVIGLAHGAHVLAAKPLGRSLAEASAIVGAAATAGSLAVAQQMRYFPCFTELRRIVTGREYGPLISASVRMALDGRGWVPGTAWRLRMDHPVLLEAGIHHFDLLRWCLGAELTVTGAVEWNPPWSPFRVGASVTTLLTTVAGAPVRYDATFAPHPDEALVRFDSGWEVICRDARITVVNGGVYVDGAQSGSGPTEEPVPLEDLNQLLFAEWLAARDAGEAPPFTGTDNLRSVTLLDHAIAAASRQGAPDKVEVPA
jgi:predicted dehydrogenase